MNSSRFAIAIGCISAVAACAELGLGGDLQVTMTLDVAEVSPSAPARISVTAKNTTSSTIVWGQGGSCQLDAAARVNGKWVPIVAVGRGCTKELRPWRLSPGETRTEVFNWGGGVLRGEQAEQLPPGTYSVRGEAADKGTSESALVTIRGAP